jgi:hypothetical protein
MKLNDNYLKTNLGYEYKKGRADELVVHHNNIAINPCL